MRFRPPIGTGAMHREYEILCHFNGTPNMSDTQEKIDTEAPYAVAIQDLLTWDLIYKNGETYRLTAPGREVLRLCQE